MIIIDIDECTLGTHGCSVNAICENSIGSYTCTCKSGYEGTGDSCNGWFFNISFSLKENFRIQKERKKPMI